MFKYNDTGGLAGRPRSSKLCPSPSGNVAAQLLPVGAQSAIHSTVSKLPGFSSLWIYEIQVSQAHLPTALEGTPPCDPTKSAFSASAV